MTFPTKFSERMRAAMFPQQNLKRREAPFCWARRRFAPAKCRNALLLSSKSAKLSFSQEKLLTNIATNLHTYPINGHASVSGSHLGKRSDEENPQRCYDPSDDRDGTAGVPSTQPVLVREPTSAFSVRWGGSYCPLCSTPRNRGRSAPRKAPSYLSPNQGIDPLT